MCAQMIECDRVLIRAAITGELTEVEAAEAAKKLGLELLPG